MKNLYPFQLLIGNVQFNLAGQGSRPCARIYAAPQTGAVVEAWPASIVRSGPHYALAVIPDAPELGTIKIDRSSTQAFPALRPGVHVLMAGIEQTAGGHRATFALPVAAPQVADRVPRRPPPLPPMETGVIASLQAPTWGWITRDDGARVFLHVSRLTGVFRAGTRVTFRSQYTDKGLTAIEAHSIGRR